VCWWLFIESRASLFMQHKQGKSTARSEKSATDQSTHVLIPRSGNNRENDVHIAFTEPITCPPNSRCIHSWKGAEASHMFLSTSFGQGVEQEPDPQGGKQHHHHVRQRDVNDTFSTICRTIIPVPCEDKGEEVLTGACTQFARSPTQRAGANFRDSTPQSFVPTTCFFVAQSRSSTISNIRYRAPN
jgi:hypothetical protein